MLKKEVTYGGRVKKIIEECKNYIKVSRGKLSDAYAFKVNQLSHDIGCKDESYT